MQYGYPLNGAKRLLPVLFLFLLSLTTFAQQSVKKEGWHLLDQQKDGVTGISLDQAYQLLKGRKSTPVIVAVIDSGIDTAHEDLRPVLWRNEREISGNGKDDDGNGYTDDLYGWNFCGSRTGENLASNSWEITRVYHGWKGEFEGKKEEQIPADRKFLYRQWTKAASLLDKDYKEAMEALPRLEEFLQALEGSSGALQEHLSVTEFRLSQVKPLLQHPTERVARSAALWSELFSRTDDTTVTQTRIIKEVTDYKNSFTAKVKRKTEAPEDNRGRLNGDNYLDINDRFYGNNNLKSGSGDHGTLVSGVIGAVRGNGKGIDGIADNVRIMAIRAVPGGDEHDKDVALAIRYAVDNGARVINMSFGKPVSPYKSFVDDAVRYAASKGVLLVHASGNDGKDITEDHFYPHPLLLDGKKATNYLTIGASGDVTNGGYAASFSNYSKKWVDLFAPGVYIYSTATDNRYNGADGTSLAAPVVSGVAALLFSYFPQLKPEQVVSLLLASGTPVTTEVTQPGGGKTKVPFSTLSSSGKIVNAGAAVKLALEGEKKKK